MLRSSFRLTLGRSHRAVLIPRATGSLVACRHKSILSASYLESVSIRPHSHSIGLTTGQNRDHWLVQSRTMKIYTKTGDKGESGLYSGERRPKNDDIFMALGDNDELNAVLGLVYQHCLERHIQLAEQIEEIQSRLFDVGAAIATPPGKASQRKLDRVAFNSENVLKLERWIDEMDEQLPPLRNFILPLHVARAVCRRVERRVVPLVRSGQVPEEVGKFLNRLSDYLFVAARFAAKADGTEERIWKKE